MKRVKVYVISETVRAVHGNSAEIYRYSPHAVVLDSGEAVAARNGERIAVPVHQYRYADGREEFYALEPEVAYRLADPAARDTLDRAKEIESEIKGKMDRLRVAYLNQREHADELVKALRTLDLQAFEFRTSPWYVRVWRALRREV